MATDVNTASTEGTGMKTIPTDISNYSFESKDNSKVPGDANILKKRITVRVKEIENGFLITKNYDITYEVNDKREYLYYDKQWYSKTNPMKIKEPDSSEAKSDSFVDDME